MRVESTNVVVNFFLPGSSDVSFFEIQKTFFPHVPVVRVHITRVRSRLKVWIRLKTKKETNPLCSVEYMRSASYNFQHSNNAIRHVRSIEIEPQLSFEIE